MQFRVKRGCRLAALSKGKESVREEAAGKEKMVAQAEEKLTHQAGED